MPLLMLLLLNYDVRYQKPSSTAGSAAARGLDSAFVGADKPGFDKALSCLFTHSLTLSQSVSHCPLVNFCQSFNKYHLPVATLATPEERPASPERKSQLVRVTQIIALFLYLWTMCFCRVLGRILKT